MQARRSLLEEDNNAAVTASTPGTVLRPHHSVTEKRNKDEVSPLSQLTTTVRAAKTGHGSDFVISFLVDTVPVSLSARNTHTTVFVG